MSDGSSALSEKPPRIWDIDDPWEPMNLPDVSALLNDRDDTLRYIVALEGAVSLLRSMSKRMRDENGDLWDRFGKAAPSDAEQLHDELYGGMR